MKKYALPLLMHMMSCATDENNPPVVQRATQETTAPVRHIGPVPDVQNAPLHPVFPGYQEDASMVRELNAYERREAGAVIERARFLTPYAVQLAHQSVLAKPQAEYTGEQLNVLYTQFVDKADQALQNGTLLVEPALADRDADGIYYPLVIEEQKVDSAGNISFSVTEKRVVYAFGNDLYTWNVGIFIHEVAHDTFPPKHSLDMPMLQAERGKHVIENNDQVYGVSELFSVLDAPKIYVSTTIHAARAGKTEPHKTLVDLMVLRDAPDAEWSRVMLDGVYKSFQGFLPEVGISQEELATIYFDSNYREHYRKIMNEEIDEFAGEVNMSESELLELQTRYQIDETSDEFWMSMYLIITPMINGKPDPEIAAENERRIREHSREVEKINSAVRRTRDWK